MTCQFCSDGDGGCAFPFYGLAPHRHTPNDTIIAPRESWPANFVEDPEARGCGTYTHCTHCGAGSAALKGE